MMAPVDRRTVASMIDHTLLAPEATPAQIRSLCDEAVDLGVAAVCVSSRWVPEAVSHLDGALPVATVVGFPSGAHATVVKALETRAAVDQGATEIDMVVSLGAVIDRDADSVAHDVATVRASAPTPVLLKVIIESALFDLDTVGWVSRLCIEAGADYVKTSTGFHPSGGASVDAVRAMRSAVGPEVGVKASGGIRDAATAVAMIEAGATRIGASSSRAILDGLT